MTLALINRCVCIVKANNSYMKQGFSIRIFSGVDAVFAYKRCYNVVCSRSATAARRQSREAGYLVTLTSLLVQATVLLS